MSNWRRYIPEGTNDILFENCINKINIERKIEEYLKDRGFNQIITPTLEFYDVFNLDIQPIQQEKMYKLVDNQGRILVLKPDMTTPIVRVASTKLENYTRPIKLCYTSNIFRIRENFNGKLSEITQAGIEIIGSDSIKSDLEALITAIGVLINIGIDNFKIELGQADIFKSMINNSNLNENQIEKLRKLIENKNFAAIESFIEEFKSLIHIQDIKLLQKLPNLFGNIDVLSEARKLTNNKLTLKALNNIEEIYSMLEDLGLSKYITIDLGMVHHMNYYTGLIFKGYTNMVGNDILSGGRYDNLSSEFGSDLPATGFALNIENILETLKKSNKFYNTEKYDMMLFYEKGSIKETYNIAELLRYNNLKVEISIDDNIENTLDYVESKEIPCVLHIKESYKAELIFKKCPTTVREKIVTALNNILSKNYKIIEK